MSKISKLLVMLLALVMVVSLFAGCQPTDQPEETKKPAESKPNETEPDETEPEETEPKMEAIEWPLAEPYTFTLGAYGDKDYQSLLEKCEWYKDLCKMTNVFIEAVPLGEDCGTTLNAKLQSNSAPDALACGSKLMNNNRVVELAEQGYALPLEDYLVPEVMPNYMRLLEAVPEAKTGMTCPDGHIYALARIAGVEGSGWESPLAYNKEWLKQVPGFENGNTPKNIDEMTTVLKYYRDHDMNGNGKDDEIPFLLVCSSAYGDNQGSLQGLMNLWGIPTKDGGAEYYVVISDDKEEVTIAPYMEAYRECLKTINVWYEEGLLWDEFFSAPSRDTHNGTANGEEAIWGFYNGSQKPYQYSEDPNSKYQKWGWQCGLMEEPFDTGYEVNYFINPGQKGYKNVWMVLSGAEHPEYILGWYDHCLSLKGGYSGSAGVENENERYVLSDGKTTYPDTWHWDEEKGAVIAYNADDDPTNDYVSLDGDLNEERKNEHPFLANIFTGASVFYGYTPQEYKTQQWPNDPKSIANIFQEYIDQNREELFSYVMWPRPYVTAEQAEELATLWPTVSKTTLMYEAMFINGQMDVNNDAHWDRYMSALDGAGGQDLVEVLTEICEVLYDELGGTNNIYDD